MDRTDREDARSIMKILIYDLETAPTMAYVWSAWKQNISPNQVVEHGRVICWAAKWLGEKQVHFGAEWKSDMFIEDLADLMDEADAVITYNGDKFDQRVLNTALLIRGLKPLAPAKSIDMYKVVKKRFATFHGRMDSIAELLGIQGKLDTGGMELWIGVMNKDPKAQKKMERYNVRDIKVLEKIYEHLKGWISSHPTDTGSDTGKCPNCGSKDLQRRGYHVTKVSKFQRYQCTSCGSWHRGRASVLDKSNRPGVVSL